MIQKKIQITINKEINAFEIFQIKRKSKRVTSETETITFPTNQYIQEEQR